MGIDMIAASPNMDESDLESLEIMRNASNFMSRTLNGVLSMHKIEEGKFEIALEPIALDAMINNAASTFMGTIKSKDLILNVQCSQHLPPKVLADGLRLEHVVSNLVSNAIKFSPPGGKIVIAAECLRRRPSEDGMSETADIIVSVTDNGPGIDAEGQKMLFEQFVQIRPNKLQAGQGSGLGLAFCKNIVALHMGEISVVSTPGIGSTFRFIIPFQIVPNDLVVVPLSPSASASAESTAPESTAALSVRPASPAAAPPRAPSSPDSPAFSMPDGALEVLVVDDADSNRKILMMLLKRKNIKCVGAENGKVASDLIAQDIHRFKLVLMDNLMPVLTGTEATTQIRLNGFPYLICGITGNVTDSDIREFVTAGANLVLGKPIKMEMIESLLSFLALHGSLSRHQERQHLTFDPEGRLSWVEFTTDSTLGN
jgi:CheY-like chemotaxis protein/anti-sigma regulatory factor (Ser/Thr protein kinase)